MADSWGNYLRLTLFGESHGPAIGVTVEGLPAGFEPDLGQVRREMARRAPGQSALTTARKEEDAFEILSGLWRGRLTGSVLTAIIFNGDQRSRDYGDSLDIPRPGHADYTGHVRFLGQADHRGGGHFSGRLTAPLLFAGALCKQWLGEHGITFSARITRIGPVQGDGLTEAMREEILSAKADLDSVGGIIECQVEGLPAGLGAPFFDSFESVLAHLLFSVPAVKGVEFGDGFAMAERRASATNDPMVMVGGEVCHLSNHNGGVLGGITNGETVRFRAAIKPTASIARAQKSVSLSAREDRTLNLHGRHDPCIVPRAVPVIEAAAALATAELWKEKNAWQR